MAKLTITEAARLTQVDRSTLHRAIKRGNLSRDPDGRLDTAELLRAGFQLHAPAPSGATVHHDALPQLGTTMQQDATPATPVTPYAGNSASVVEITGLQRECALLQQQLDATRSMLQQQLDATHDLLQRERDQTVERERDYREQIRYLSQLLHDMQQRYDRLLEAPRPAPTPPLAPSVPPTSRLSAWQRVRAFLGGRRPGST